MCSIAARSSANGLEIAVHDEGVDVALSGMEECFRKCADDPKFKALPKPYGAVIGTDYKIELHGAKSAFSRAIKRVSAHGPCHATAGCGDGCHEIGRAS